MRNERKNEVRIDRTRRRIAGGLAALAAAPLAAGLLPEAVTMPLARQEKEEKRPKAQQERTEEEKPGPHRAEAEAMMGLVALRVGKYLDEAKSREVRSSIEHSFSGAEEMSAAGLGDAEEPDLIFTPFRREDAR